jgi:hypothetical protein
MHLRTPLAAAALLVASASQAAEADAMAAKIMYSAWQCSIYAELKGDTDAQGRLFTLGYKKGKQFMDAAAAGTITAEEGRTIVPIVVGLLMAGPTPEFVLGRIFESAAGDAYDDVATEHASGLPRAPKDYVIDDKLQAIIASKEYSAANCEILQ